MERGRQAMGVRSFFVKGGNLFSCFDQTARIKTCARLRSVVLACAVAVLVAGCSTTSHHSSPSSACKAHGGNVASGPASHSNEPAHESISTKHLLPIPHHPSIDAWTAHYAERNPRSFQILLERAEAYVVPAQRIFARQGLPEELVYVALVESGFRPTARSHANAVGMWQFISITGERFGLQQNEWLDERRHPFKAAQAAGEYLSHLYDLFDCWALALAAYNCGENRLRSVLQATGFKTFWELQENGYLPAETRDYVPKILAAVRISRNPEKYGFQYQPCQYTPWFETVLVPGGLRLCQLSERAGLELSTLLKHNPELSNPLIPPYVLSYELRVPVGTGDSVAAALGKNFLVAEGLRSFQVNMGSSRALGFRAASPEAVQAPVKPLPYSARRGETVQNVAKRFRASAGEFSMGSESLARRN